MEYKDMSREQLLEMVRNELETVANFVEKVNEETDFNFQMFLTSAIIDESDRSMHGGKVIHGDIDILRMLTFKGLTDLQEQQEKEQEEDFEMLEGIITDFIKKMNEGKGGNN